jgi:hypothetical protein
VSIMDRLHQGGNVPKPIMTIYGRPGIGKTTLAAHAPNPIFFETERGLTNPELSHVQTFGLLHSLEEFNEGLAAVAQHHGKQKWETVVIDSIDRLNPLIERAVCAANKWKSLEEGAYGKGKNLFREEWQKVLTKLIRLRDECSVGIILLGHHAMAKISPPDADPFTQYTLTLDEKVRQLVIADSDVVAFATYPTHTVSSDQGFGKKATRAITEAPVLAVRETGAHVAKNRYGMPDKLPMSWEALAQHIPCYATKTKEAE